MNYIDLIIAIPLVWGIFVGFKNGLIIEVASLAALLLGIFGAIHFSDLTANFLVTKLNITTQYINLIAFAVTFVGIVILVHLLAKMVDKLVKAVALGFVNRLLGMVFGLVKYAFIISIILVIINAVNRNMTFISKEKIENSILYKPLSDFAPGIFPYLDFQEIKKDIKDFKDDKGITI
ncbi:MAG: CvpA family protein [Bacteroidales bacterium]|nr:CvpA family protein [Bacteroidales bacterium]